MFFHIHTGFLIFLSLNREMTFNGREGYMYIHDKTIANYMCMERNNLNMCQQIFMIFLHYDCTMERKPPFDFHVHPICRYRVMGLRFLKYSENILK